MRRQRRLQRRQSKEGTIADRRVSGTGKDRDDDITKLCGSWGSAGKTEAIQHIETRTHRYYVQQPGTSRVDVHMVDGPTGKYLRTDADPASKNNLDNLPDC
jgi:hypothetical protein